MLFRLFSVEMKGHIFNIDNGYLEGLCRGFKNGVLRQTDYLNLVQCETLDGKILTVLTAFGLVGLHFQAFLAFELLTRLLYKPLKGT